MSRSPGEQEEINEVVFWLLSDDENVQTIKKALKIDVMTPQKARELAPGMVSRWRKWLKEGGS